MHPQGTTVEVVGISSGSSGRNCDEHPKCGVVVELDVVLRVRRVGVDTDDGRHVNALAAYWVSDGIDRCRVGFLPKHLMKYSAEYDGKLLQVTELYKGHPSQTLRKKNERNRGVCLCALIDSPRPAKKQKTTTSQKNEAKKTDDDNKTNDDTSDDDDGDDDDDGKATTNKTTTSTTINPKKTTKKTTTSKPKQVNGFDVHSSGDESSPRKSTYSYGHLSNLCEASTSYTGVWNGSSSMDGNGSSD